ncbi:MAG: MFS transporter [Oscillospiraceae bacterium]|nr:MFS transporter [Oscillospiraceae bacterium]
MKKFNVKLLYVYKFISRCLPIYAFYTILFIERGLSVNDVALLLALWGGFAIVFEVPSAVLADRWNRKYMLVMAAILQGLCFVVWFFSHNFLMFAVGIALWGVSGAFSSGTEEGLIYDNLKSDGCEENFTKVYGRANFFANMGTFVGIASAGLLAGFFSIGNIALISAVICFVNAILASLLRERNYYRTRIKRDTASFRSYWGTFKEAGAFVKGSRIALISILFLILFASLGGYLDEFDALIINDFGLGNIWVSVILTVRFVFVALGNLLAPVLQKVHKNFSVGQIFLLNGLGCVLLTVFAVMWSEYAIVIFGLAFMLMAITEVLLVNIVQREIREEGRATVMSFCGIGQNAAMICLSLVYAVLAGIFTLQLTYVIIAVYGVLGGLVFYLIQCKYKNN